MPFLSERKLQAIPAAVATFLAKELRPSTYVDEQQVQDAARAVLHLRGGYSHYVAKQFGERSLNLALYSYLYARYPSTTREHPVAIGNSSKPKRVDFRIGGANPVLIEFAYRKPGQSKQPLQGPHNASELRKLGRFPTSQAKRRILLLVDGSKTAIPKSELKGTYDSVTRGQGGKSVRHAVTVLYVHKDADYRFAWNPAKSGK